jgi:excisionase family DNA binding protein
MGKLMTINEVADQLAVAPKTIRRWVKKGSLAGVKMPGGDWRIRPEHLDNWLKLRTVKARAI